MSDSKQVDVLLPCPFCGSSATHSFGPVSRKHYVSCDNDDCQTCGPNGDNEASAIAKWNRRAPAKGDAP